MSLWEKTKTSVSNLKIDENYIQKENSFKVSVNEQNADILINYVTNLYSNPATAVVRELLTNACDASYKNNDLITIKIEETGINENYEKEYSFSILDFGCGMNKEELIENYINYANSSKLNNYDTVGAFGLGAKSPMAVSNGYTVISSNNGKNINGFTIKRTKNGIFADPIEIEEKWYNINKSFTYVYFNGLSSNIINSMNSYIINVIMFIDNMIQYKYLNNPIINNKKDYSDFKQFKLPKHLNWICNYPVTLYTSSDNIGGVLYDLLYNGMNYYQSWGSFKRTKVYVRINNTIYSLYDYNSNNNFAWDEYENEITYHTENYCIIDIEPGFFEFAPSREELPSGQELDFLKKSLKGTNSFDKELDTIIKFLIDNKIYSSNELFNKFKYYHFANINDINCFGKNLSKKQIRIFNSLKDLAKFEKLIDDTKVDFYIFDGKKRKNCNYLEFIDSLNFKQNMFNGEFFDLNKNHYKPITIITNTKFNNKDKAKLPSKYTIKNLKDNREENRPELYNYMRKILDIWHNNYNEYYIFTKEGYTLPKELIEALTTIQITNLQKQEWKYTIPITINADYKKTVSRNSKEIKNKKVHYLHIFTEDIESRYTSLTKKENTIENILQKSKYFITGTSRLSATLAFNLSFILNKNVICINDSTAAFKKYAKENNKKIITYKNKQIKERLSEVDGNCTIYELKEYFNKEGKDIITKNEKLSQVYVHTFNDTRSVSIKRITNIIPGLNKQNKIWEILLDDKYVTNLIQSTIKPSVIKNKVFNIRTYCMSVITTNYLYNLNDYLKNKPEEEKIINTIFKIIDVNKLKETISINKLYWSYIVSNLGITAAEKLVSLSPRGFINLKWYDPYNECDIFKSIKPVDFKKFGNKIFNKLAEVNKELKETKNLVNILIKETPLLKYSKIAQEEPQCELDKIVKKEYNKKIAGIQNNLLELSKLEPEINH